MDVINCFECSYKCKDGKRVRYILTTPMNYGEVEHMMDAYNDYAVYTISTKRAEYLRSKGVILRDKFRSEYF